jgi:hypothetical protein
MRKGMLVGSGKRGYHNLIPKDPHVHSASAHGLKQPQNLSGKMLPVSLKTLQHRKIPYGYKIKYDLNLRKGEKPYIAIRKRGGISKEVWETDTVTGYLSRGALYGYFGEQRTRWKDKIVEAELRKQGLTDEGIAMYLTSTYGRHLMDYGGDEKDPAKFQKYVKKFVKDAEYDVTRMAKSMLVDKDEEGITSGKALVKKTQFKVVGETLYFKDKSSYKPVDFDDEMEKQWIVSEVNKAVREGRAGTKMRLHKGSIQYSDDTGKWFNVEIDDKDNLVWFAEVLSK